MWIVIEDNVPGSPTFGKVWVISGHAEVDGFVVDKGNLIATIGSTTNGPKHKPYPPDDKSQKSGEYAGGMVLVDDQSPVGPWLKKAKQAVGEVSGQNEYEYLGPNSNSLAYYVLARMGLMVAYTKAMRKRNRNRELKKPWAPGWGAPLEKKSGLMSEKPIG